MKEEFLRTQQCITTKFCDKRKWVLWKYPSCNLYDFVLSVYRLLSVTELHEQMLTEVLLQGVNVFTGSIKLVRIARRMFR